MLCGSLKASRARSALPGGLLSTERAEPGRSLGARRDLDATRRRCQSPFGDQALADGAGRAGGRDTQHYCLLNRLGQKVSRPRHRDALRAVAGASDRDHSRAAVCRTVYGAAMMARGEITRDAVLEAMAEYDRLGADGFRRQYGYGEATDYVLIYEGREYPSEGLYGVAYNRLHPGERPLMNLSGGVERVVPELRDLGFVVQSRRSSSDRLRTGIERVLAEYGEARRAQPFGSSAEIWSAFKELNEAFNACGPVQDRPTVHADWSAGVGNWARVAWVAFLDSRETRTTQLA